MLSPRHDIVTDLDGLVASERMMEKLLERASRAPEDPRAVAYLWNQATECRDHARILLRHRRNFDRKDPHIPYPRWRRNHGPTPEESLHRARDLAATLSGEYDRDRGLQNQPYLRKFLEILSREHAARCHELTGIVAGENLFAGLEVG